MQCTRVLAALWLALAASPLSLAQSPLKLPSGDDDYRQLIDEQRGAACEHCGVVTAIRSQQHEGPRRPNPAQPDDRAAHRDRHRRPRCAAGHCADHDLCHHGAL